MCLQAHTYTHFLALYVPASPPTHIFPRLAHLTCYFLAFICGRMKTEKTSVFRRTAKNLSLEELKYFTPQAVVFTPNYISSWQSKPHAIELSFFFFKEKESTNIFACAVSTIKKITLNVIFFCHHGFFFFFGREGTPGVNLRVILIISTALEFLPLHATLHFFLLAHPPYSLHVPTSHTVHALTSNI